MSEFKYGTKEYNNQKHRELRAQRQKVKIIDLRPYSSWKKDSFAYYSFKCNACCSMKEAPDFYIGHLQYCKMTRTFALLKCKYCHNRKLPIIKIDLRREIKCKAPTGPVPIEVLEWMKEERLKLSIRELNLSH